MKKLSICCILALLLVLVGCTAEGENVVPGTSDTTAQSFVPTPGSFEAFRLEDYRDTMEQFPSEESFGPITDTEFLLEKAEDLWIRIYGKDIRDQRPYLLSYDETAGVWLIRGTFPYPDNYVGGVANMLVENATGNVLAVWHEK